MKTQLIVGSDESGQRLDKFIADKLPGCSREKAHRSIIQGEITVNGLTKKPSFRVHAGQHIEIIISEEKRQLHPYAFAVKIIYEDEAILVVDKPCGLITHPPQEQYVQTLVNALIHMKKKLFAAYWLRPGIVHRLDKETSGVMVLAKTALAAQSLISQFKDRTIQKQYRAICHGLIAQDCLRIDLPIARDTRNRLAMKISFLKSKAAITEVTVLQRFSHETYVAIKLLTGRMHQIRVHFKFLGHPLLGDKKYGIKDSRQHLFLHSYKLGLIHPTTNQHLEFTSPLPEHFSRFLQEHLCTS